jgi:hypothetical protein
MLVARGLGEVVQVSAGRVCSAGLANRASTTRARVDTME